jgi:acetaldehyde dehydrogenase/alcohol dehydrogenase
MPRGLTASTGMDVLGHALEGYTSRQQTDFSDGLCLQAMKLVFDWLPRACNDGNDILDRDKMQNGATIAGLGFGNSNASLPHAIAHAVGATFHIPHGRAVGIALPYSLEYFSQNPAVPGAPDPIQRLALAARFIGISESSDAEAIRKLIQKIRQLASDIGEPLSLKEAIVTEEQMKDGIEQLCGLTRMDVSFLFTPCACADNQLKQLLLDIWSGKC